jgi:VanZ family protein
MLPLRYPRLWRFADILILVLVLASAMSPEMWPWGRTSGPYLVSDKVMHGLTFAFLALWYTGQYSRKSYAKLAVGLLLFGVLIELCQLMVSYRSAEWGDLLADSIGVAVGMAIAMTVTGGWSQAVERRFSSQHE